MVWLMLFRNLSGWEWLGILEDHKNLWCVILFAISFLPASFSIDYFIMINMAEVCKSWNKSVLKSSNKKYR